MRGTTRLGALGALFAAAGATAVLAWSGESLGAPPLKAWDEFGTWLAQRDAPAAALACLRVVALTVGGYSVAAIAVGIVLRLVSARRLVVLVDRFTVPPLRRLLAGTLSAGLASTGLSAVATVQLRPPAALAEELTPGSAATGDPVVSPLQSGTSPDQSDDGDVSMRRLEAGEEVEPTQGLPADRASWVVRPGQSFWSIAEAVLAEAWNRQPTDAEIVPYWQRLIDANRASLADPDNADLIFPGDAFMVPPPPAAGGPVG